MWTPLFMLLLLPASGEIQIVNVLPIASDIDYRSSQVCEVDMINRFYESHPEIAETFYLSAICQIGDMV